jgi:hypothetical protein
MKLSELGQPTRSRLVDNIIRNRKQIYFRSWANQVRKLIPPSEMSSASLWSEFLDQTRQVWDGHRDGLREKPIEELRELAAVETKRAKECGQVINIQDHKQGLER